MVKDYSRGKIYKMESPSGLIYIGSTCEPTLARRKAKHMNGYKCWKKRNIKYMTSFKLFDEDINNVKIYLIELFPCNSSDELLSREGHYIKEYNCVNKMIAGRTQKQYRIDNEEKLMVYRKQYYIDNEETIKQYYIDNKEVIQQYKLDNKEKIREYNQQYILDNKEVIKQQQQQYYEANKEIRKQQQQQYNWDNKEIIKQRNKIKVVCECGGKYTIVNKSTHFKSLKHLKFAQE